MIIMISVIVPIYKVEKELDRCIKSLVNQTYSDLEIILVDDGSPDNCPKICDQWAKKDSRINVIHKKNGGLSDARNAGYMAAKGSYISFIDSDDWIHYDFFKIMMNEMNKNDVDIVECDVIKTSSYMEDSVSNSVSMQIYDSQKALELLINDNTFHQHVWNKLYKKDVIGNILFAVGKLNEDEFWTYQIFGASKKISKIDVPMYYYYQRETSIMGQNYSLRRLDALEAKFERQLYMSNHYPSLFKLAITNFYETCIYQGQMSLLYLNDKDLKESKRIIKAYLKEIDFGDLDIPSLSLSRKIWIILSKVSFFGTCKLKNMLKKGIN